MRTVDFSSLLTRYLTHYLPVQRNLSSNTIRSYRDTFKLLLLFCRDVRLEPPAVITLHGKGGKTRSVPLMKQTVALLKDYFSENNINPQVRPDMPLFWNSRRQKLTRSGVTFILQKYAEMAREVSPDVPDHITPHVMRHTKAMNLVQADINPIYIKDLLGHADISTTEIYARADSEAKRSALEKATAQLNLPTSFGWEQDADLIEWLSSLG